MRSDEEARTFQQYPAQRLPIPVPVQIIEVDEVARARESREAEARQLEVEGLEAQQEINAATQAMTKATQSMMQAAWVSAGFVGVGTLLLFWTLSLTRQANRAAIRAVEVTQNLGEAQLRAYIGFGGFQYRSHWYDEDKEKIFWRFQFNISNTGQTPARKVNVRTNFIITDDLDFQPLINENFEPLRVMIGIRESVGVGTFDIDGDLLAEIRNGKKRFYFLCEVNYGNSINPDSKHTVRIGFHSGAITGDPEKYWNPENPVNIQLVHIASLNCSDDECEHSDPCVKEANKLSVLQRSGV